MVRHKIFLVSRHGIDRNPAGGGKHRWFITPHNTIPKTSAYQSHEGLLICTYPPRKITMAKSTHKSSSKKHSSAKAPAKRRTPPASKTKKLSKSVRKAGNGNAAAKKADDEARQIDKANAHLLKACQIMYEIRTGKRKAKEPSLKWLKSLMMRTSV